MARQTLVIIGIVAIMLMAMTLSGCIGGGQNSPAASTSPSSSPSSSTGSNVQAKTTISGDTITITGVKTDQSNDQLSGEFELAEGAYLMEWNDVGGPLGFFTASIDSTDGKDGTAIVSLTEEKGSSELVVGSNSLLTPAGKYRMDVGNGGTYSVTFSKPPTGSSPPVTITASKGDNVAKPVMLKAGKFTISVKHSGWSQDKIGTTMIGVWDVKTGKDAVTDSGWVSSENEELTGEAPADGVYIFSTSWSAYAGGEATLTQ